MKFKKALTTGLLLAASLSCGEEATAPPVSPAATTRAQQEIPISGAAVPGMKSYDQVVSDFMRKYSIPGGAVAVMRDGRLIYARGFNTRSLTANLEAEVDIALRNAFAGVTSFPAHDLFSTFR